MSLILTAYLLLKHIRKSLAERRAARSLGTSSCKPEASEDNGLDLSSALFPFNTIEAATDHFNDACKLGEGGFGPVYKGRLPDGEEIAVKRLSKLSQQGLKEFKTEVELISQLQHKNLVRLLGCCVYGEEKLLVYEFMPNRSLATFLFDPEKRGALHWSRRYYIIKGIARGLLYLHQDSRLKIIHRDLKAGNVLLDEQFNPKISDFGMARMFGGDQNLDSTMNVVGTIGYMSPEYAMAGQISEKSDVFSFGVLLLEIVSGKRNISHFDDDHALNLLGYAWQLWKENRVAELIDPLMRASESCDEVLKCIKVGLLCAQQYPEDRPAMSVVVSVLSGDIVLPDPKQIAFYGGRRPSGDDGVSLLEGSEALSVNDLSITEVEGR